MQGDEGIGIIPVPARFAVPVHNGDVRAGFVDEGVGKRQACSTAADDQLVCLDVLNGIFQGVGNHLK